MGMYTALHFNSQLKKDTPKDVLEALQYMLGDRTTITTKPEHKLFTSSRWPAMLRMDSYYFDEDTHSTLRYDKIADQFYLCIRCNLKNYDGEIEKFVDWILPYCDKEEGDFLGFSRYEETEDPTLIYYHN